MAKEIDWERKVEKKNEKKVEKKEELGRNRRKDII